MTTHSVFTDNIGRTIISELVEETESTLLVKNPAVLAVSPNPQTGQITVQIVPYLFKEFVSNSSRDTVQWRFNKNLITTALNLELDERLLTQYRNMHSAIQIAPGGVSKPVESPSIIKLFDE